MATDEHAAEVVPPGKEYLLTKGRPLGYFQIGHTYSGFRLRIENDTAEVYSPFHRVRERYPAYRGDSLASFPDSLYFVYEVLSDSTLRGVVKVADRVVEVQEYKLGDRLSVQSLGDEVIGQTYRLKLDQQDYLVHFSSDSIVKGGEPEIRVHLYTFQQASGALEPVASGISNRAEYTTIPLYFSFRPEDTGGRRGVLLLTGDDKGAPQTYVSYDGADVNYLSGPYPLQVVPPALPGNVGMEELAELLSNSFAQTHIVNDEPAADKLRYAYPDDFLRFGGIEAAEVDELDFEFRSDGYFAIFSGDRVLDQGEWSISPDRNFIELKDEGTGHTRRQFINNFDADKLTLPIQLKIKTREPHGTQLQSYFDAIAAVTFSR